MQRLKVRRSTLRSNFALEGGPLTTPRRLCLACLSDFSLRLDQDPEAVFFCADCSSPPGPGDELGVGD